MNNISKRYVSLDYLRGLTALIIMIYHLFRDCFHPTDAGSFLGRMGIYGVSLFFVLSGLSMAIAYDNYFKGFGTIIRFFIRRFFRIWPLFWITILLTLFYRDIPHWDELFYDFTTLFGFSTIYSTIVEGGWSIGSEMVFYILTPLVLIIYSKSKFIGNIGFFVSLICAFYIAFRLFDEKLTLGAQWYIYVDWLNNFCLYYAGIFIWFNFKNLQIDLKLNTLILLICLSVFLFYPVWGDQLNIVKGLNRIVFVSATILIVFCFFKLNFKRENLFLYLFEQLGIATYGVYLLHPLFFKIVKYWIHIDVNSSIFIRLTVMFITVICTILVALILYKWIEKPIIRFGKKIAEFIPVKMQNN